MDKPTPSEAGVGGSVDDTSSPVGSLTAGRRAVAGIRPRSVESHPADLALLAPSPRGRLRSLAIPGRPATSLRTDDDLTNTTTRADAHHPTAAGTRLGRTELAVILPAGPAGSAGRSQDVGVTCMDLRDTDRLTSGYGSATTATDLTSRPRPAGNHIARIRRPDHRQQQSRFSQQVIVTARRGPVIIPTR